MPASYHEITKLRADDDGLHGIISQITQLPSPSCSRPPPGLDREQENVLDVSADIVEQVDPIFYGDPKTAAMKVLRGT